MGGVATKETASAAYSGSAAIGRASALFGAITTTVIFSIVIAVGIYLLTKKSLYNKQVEGIIDGVTCTQIPGKQTEYQCSLNVTYNVNFEFYNKKFAISSNRDYQDKKTITIYYNSHDPNDSSITKDKSKLYGIIMIIFSVLFLMFIWGSFILTWKYKPLAAASGVGAVFSRL